MDHDTEDFSNNLSASLAAQHSVTRNALYVIKTILSVVPYYQYTNAGQACLDPETIPLAIKYIQEKLPSFLRFLQHEPELRRIFYDEFSIVFTADMDFVVTALETIRLFHTQFLASMNPGDHTNQVCSILAKEVRKLSLGHPCLAAAGQLVIFLDALSRMLHEAIEKKLAFVRPLRIQLFLATPAASPATRLHPVMFSIALFL